MKHCNGCNQDLSESAFSEGRSRCRKCRSKEEAQRRKEDPFTTGRTLTNCRARQEKAGSFRTEGAIFNTIVTTEAIESFLNSESQNPNLSRYQQI